MNNSIEDELDAIRIALYEETKHLGISERTERINRIAQEAAEKYGFTILPSPLPSVEEAREQIAI